jgi:hypothetical protein
MIEPPALLSCIETQLLRVGAAPEREGQWKQPPTVTPDEYLTVAEQEKGSVPPVEIRQTTR